ncbi:MAG: bifunctional oligoribonuclease/PAP phosphatase NrnA [Chloroflexi bacterium]|nr:bifunctional oligoribonuclease/PAP phosphatase NrnA [Chloroflexota bacterium]
MTTINATNVNWARASEAVAAAAPILLVTHLNPDGDAIGALVGLANALCERGKTVTAAVDGGVPEYLKFLPGTGQVQADLTEGQWALMISLDASDEERTGRAGAYGRAHSEMVINLDHHPTNTMFGDVHLVLPEAVSATEIVYHWLVALEHPLTVDVAQPLLTGLVTDTIGFRTSNVRPETLTVAQRLMEAGASLHEAVARTLESKPFSTINLWKYALQNLDLDGAIISATITKDDFKRANIPEPTDGGLVSELAKVEQAKIAVVFKETPQGRVELSMRCALGYDVGAVALALGGGGHKQAAGATIDGPLEVAKPRVIKLLREAIKRNELGTPETHG